MKEKGEKEEKGENSGMMGNYIDTKEQLNKVQSSLVIDILVGLVGLEPTTGRI